MKRSVTMPREFYIPKGAIKISDKKSDAVAYISSSVLSGQPCAKIFYGKQGKPIANYRYKNEADRAKSITAYFAARQEAAARKAAYAAERNAFAKANPYKVGDIFRTCWGYDQTNVEWFEAIEVKGCFVTVREINAESINTGDMTGRCVPLPGEFKAKSEPKKCKATKYGLKIDSCRTASYQEPKNVAGVPVYTAAEWSSYG
jgi:hypothetical protein